MKTRFTIKNFRVFDENGATIDLKPLTILTGCNSSGKSSIVKAAFLLNSFMKQVNKAIDKGEKIELSKYKLDFTSYPNNLLGRFDKVIHEGSASPQIRIGYSVYSCMLSKDVDVELVFAADNNDVLNNAYLVSLTMSTDEGVFYSSDKENGSFCNLNIIKKYCPEFVKIEFTIDNFCGLNSQYEFDLSNRISKDEFKAQGNAMLDILRSYDRNKVMDVVKYIRNKKGDFHCIGTKEYLDLFKWTEANDSYFNIPVLKYLSSIKKNDILSCVEKDLIFDSNDNALCASPDAISIASRKVINEFLLSDFNTFEEFFLDYEHRHFEKINCIVDTIRPGMLNIGMPQSYTTSYPSSGSVARIDLEANDNKNIEENKEQRIKEWENLPLTFNILYEIVMLWNEKHFPGKNDYFCAGLEVTDAYGVTLHYPDGYHHYAFNMLTTFAKRLVEEIISPKGFDNMSYVSSSRATVKKLYALDEKDDFTELLQRYFEAKRVFLDRCVVKSSDTPEYEVNSFMNHWIKQFGIGESLSFKLDEEGLGVKIYVHKSSDNKIRLLADEGYGITQLISILLQIETAILTAKGRKTNNFVGLSVFDKYDYNVFHFEENTIAIEEPEIHLHPSYQSKLAEMFYDAYIRYGIHFIIETHSEYLIRKTQVIVAGFNYKSNQDTVEQCPFQTYYVPQEGTPYSLGYRKDGKFKEDFGSGFYDEASNLAFDIL
jgi:hypothetical protein